MLRKESVGIELGIVRGLEDGGLPICNILVVALPQELWHFLEQRTAILEAAHIASLRDYPQFVWETYKWVTIVIASGVARQWHLLFASNVSAPVWRTKPTEAMYLNRRTSSEISSVQVEADALETTHEGSEDEHLSEPAIPPRSEDHGYPMSGKYSSPGLFELQQPARAKKRS